MLFRRRRRRALGAWSHAPPADSARSRCVGAIGAALLTLLGPSHRDNWTTSRLGLRSSSVGDAVCRCLAPAEETQEPRKDPRDPSGCGAAALLLLGIESAFPPRVGAHSRAAGAAALFAAAFAWRGWRCSATARAGTLRSPSATALANCRRDLAGYIRSAAASPSARHHALFRRQLQSCFGFVEPRALSSESFKRPAVIVILPAFTLRCAGSPLAAPARPGRLTEISFASWRWMRGARADAATGAKPV